MIPPGLLALLLVVPLDGEGTASPFKRAGGAPLEYRGPGREAAPADAGLVIGWFGPSDPEHPVGGDAWRGALLAVDTLEDPGEVLLVPGWSENPWSGGAVEVTRLVYERGALALLGPMDGASAHLAEHVALKARITLLSSGSTDTTVIHAGVPWTFSCLPDDEAVAPVLARAASAAAVDGPVVVVAGAEHDAHVALEELVEALREEGRGPRTVLELDPRRPEVDTVARRVADGQPGAVVVLAPVLVGAPLVQALRLGGYGGPILGGPSLARAAFGRLAGGHAEGVMVPRLWEPSPRWDAFVRAYEERFGRTPDHIAGQSFDAVRLLRDAARLDGDGANRARLRDAVRRLSPWQGAAGVVRWDNLGRNRRAPGLAVWREGRLRAFGQAEGMRESALLQTQEGEDVDGPS